MKKYPTSIVLQLTLIAVCVVGLSALTIGGAVAYLGFQAQFDQLNLTQQARAQVVAQEINAYVDDLQRKLTYLARVPGLTNLDATTQRQLLEGLVRQNSAYELVGITNAQGQPQQAISPVGDPVPDDWAATDAFRRAFREQEDFIGAVEMLPDQTWPTALLAVPVRDAQDKVAGILFARINLKFLWAVLDDNPIGESGYVYVVSRQHLVIASSGGFPEQFVFNALPPPVLQQLFSSPITHLTWQRYQGLRGADVLGNISLIPSTNWHVVVELPVTEAYAPLFNLLEALGVGLVAGVLIAGLLSASLARRLLRPLQELTLAADRLSQGDLETRVTLRAENELKILAEAFNHMAGQLSGTITQLHLDIAERQRVEAALALEKEHLAVTLDSIGDAVIVTDARGQVTRMNPTAEKLTGWSLGEATGQDLPEVFNILNAQTRQTVANPADKILQTGQIVGLANHTVLMARNGPEYQIADSAAPIRNAPGEIVGIVLVFRDVSEAYRVQTALRESEAGLRESQRVAHVGHWTWDTRPNKVAWSDEMKRIFGLDPATFDGDLTQIIAQAIHPDDREKVNASNETVLTEGKPAPLEYRVVWPDQFIHTVLAIPGNAVLNEVGEVIQLTGVVQDITERKQAEEQIKTALAEKETLLRELYHRTKNNMQVISALLDMQAAEIDDPRLHTAFRDTQNRIQAMALVHEKLYQARDLSRVNLKSYIEDLAQLLISTYRVAGRVTLVADLDEVRVLIDTAMPCGLILNELISNTLKYAFPYGHAGEIQIQLRQTATGEIQLRVADNGVGVSPGFNFRRDGRLGLQNVFGIGERQLGGQVSFEAQAGVACQIIFKNNAYKSRV